MKTTNILTLSVGALAFMFSACGGSNAVTVNTTNSANKANSTVSTNANAATANTAAPAAATSPANATAPVDGQILNIEEGGITMTVPKGMSFSKEGTDTIVKTEDNGVDTRFTVLSNENMDEAIVDAFKEVGEYVTDAQFASKEPKKSVQNGIEIYSWNGTGKASNGDDVQFQLAILAIPDSPKKPVLALTYAEAESLSEHQADLMKFFQSVRKL